MAWRIFCIIANLAADSINATLITNTHPQFKKGLFPMFKPIETDELAYKDWKLYYHPTRNSISSLILPVHVSSPLQRTANFMYCALKKFERDPYWDFSYLMETFDAFVWILITLATLLVSLLAYRTFSKNVSTSSFQQNLFESLSVLLTPSLSKRDYSKLFIVWMFSCTVITTYYTGDMTALVITPPAEVTIANLKDVHQNRYTLAHTCDLVRTLKLNFDAMENYGVYINDNFRFLRQLIKNASYCVEKGSIGVSPENLVNFVADMLDKGEIVTLMLWQAAISLATEMNAMITAGESIPVRHRRKKCYVGKELVTTGLPLFGLIPPDSVQLARGFQRVIDSGIVARWIHEHYELHYAERAQDRVRFISPTKLPRMEEDKAFGIALRGKTVSIFALWGACCCMCLATLAAEIIIINTRCGGDCSLQIKQNGLSYYCFVKYLKYLIYGRRMVWRGVQKHQELFIYLN